MKKRKWLYILAAVLVALLIFALVTGDPQTRARLPHMLVSVGVGLAVLLAVFSLAWLLSQKNANREAKFRKSAVPVTGRVIKVERMRMAQPRDGIYGVGEDMYLLRAEYEYEGTHYATSRRVYFGRPDYNPGDAISIYVDPKSPGKSKILADQNLKVQD